MILAVYDCNVLISAIGWGGYPRACLDLLSTGQVTLCVTTEVWEEYEQKIPQVLAEKRPHADPRLMLDKLLTVACFVSPAPLGKRRSRDVKDDRYLACALGAGAEAIVTSDRDLLILDRPFGVRILTPLEFVRLVRGSASL